MNEKATHTESLLAGCSSPPVRRNVLSPRRGRDGMRKRLQENLAVFYRNRQGGCGRVKAAVSAHL